MTRLPVFFGDISHPLSFLQACLEAQLERYTAVCSGAREAMSNLGVVAGAADILRDGGEHALREKLEDAVKGYERDIEALNESLALVVEGVRGNIEPIKDYLEQQIQEAHKGAELRKSIGYALFGQEADEILGVRQQRKLDLGHIELLELILRMVAVDARVVKEHTLTVESNWITGRYR